MNERRDKRGRRIGRNWWREYVTELLFFADQTWWERMENETSMYPAEMAEFRETNPRPTLKNFLVELKGMNREPSQPTVPEHDREERDRSDPWSPAP